MEHKPFIYFDTTAKFNACRKSATPEDDSYILAPGDEPVSGTPELLWNQIAFVNDEGLIYTKGRFYSREVEDSLYSTSTTNALSAAQGKKLRELIEQSGGGEFMQSFKHVRLVFNQTYRNGSLSTLGASIAEWYVFDNEGTDITRLEGNTYAADSVYSTKFDVQYAFDCDTTTSWGSLNTPSGAEHWLQVNFANPQIIAGIGVTPKAGSFATCRPYKMSVLGSNDGTDWITLDTYDALDDETGSMWTDQVRRDFDVDIPVTKSLEDAPDGSLYLRTKGLWVSADTLDITPELFDEYPKPDGMVRVYFTTNDPIPTTKDEDDPILAYGTVKIHINGHVIDKYASIEVQGKSSANKPKKNFTFSIYDDEECTVPYKFRIGSFVPHSEYVYKANYIDSTQARNIAANRLWEQIIYAHDKAPFRGNEGVKDYDTGALCHVDGYPCQITINGQFYGIGDWNIGKKRDNYDMDKTNQKHMQMQAEPRASLTAYSETQWEIRNPGTPDDTFAQSVGVWFADNSLTGDTFKERFPNHHSLRNAIDYYLFAEYLYADDILDNNIMLTTWDGDMFYMLPYDLDTVWGLTYNGLYITDAKSGSVVDSTLGGALPNGINSQTKAFWKKFGTAFHDEIVERFDQLREKGILATSNVAGIFSELQRPFGNAYALDLAKWTAQPSRNITSYRQVLEWSDTRLEWMNAQYHPVEPTSISITGVDTVIDNATFKATFAPADCTMTDATWSITSGSEYATIGADTGVLYVTDTSGQTHDVVIRATSVAVPTLYAEKSISVRKEGSYDYIFEAQQMDGDPTQLVDTGIQIFSDANDKWTIFAYVQDNINPSEANATFITCSDETQQPYCGMRIEGLNNISGNVKYNTDESTAAALRINGTNGSKYFLNSETKTLVTTAGTTAPSMSADTKKYPVMVSRNGSVYKYSFDGIAWTEFPTMSIATTEIKKRRLLVGGQLKKDGTLYRYFKTEHPVCCAVVMGIADYPFTELVEKYS